MCVCVYKKGTAVFLIVMSFVCKPLELREVKSSPYKVAVLGVWVKDKAQGDHIIELATALESGR